MIEGRRPRRPGFAPVFWGSVALFTVLFAFLTYQVSVGNDPSLASAGGGAARPVLLRKVIRRRVVTTVTPTLGPTGVGGPVTTSSAPVSTSYGSAPVTTSAS